jgi:cation diffusion facilitator family transporter
VTPAPDTAVENACSVHAPPKVKAKGETRTRWVVVITFVMMVGELVVGTMSRSLALTADGWHMSTHVGALGMSALAYWYARTRAKETRFAFGTGKVYALSGFTSAGLLLAVALAMIATAISRLFNPETVSFNEALPVAVLGLLVNLASAALLGIDHDHDDDHGHADHDHGKEPGHDHAHHHDHNLRAAYLHVVADALTSVLAIAAILVGHYLGWGWFDPLVAIFGAVVIIHWGLKLLSECARQLVDLDPSTAQRERVRTALEASGDTRVEDLHLWTVGPGQMVCVVSVSTSGTRSLKEYKALVTAAAPVDHLTVEICRPGEVSG